MRIVFLTLFVMLAGPILAFGRGVPALSYAQLMEQSDLVVIVHSLGTRDPVRNDAIVPVEPARDYLTPIFTKFQVLAVLKGRHEGETLELCHYKYKPDSPGVGNGPLLVRFPKAEDNEIRQSDKHGSWMMRVPNDFVLFLKTDSEGRLTFVTGQFDAEPSVRQIHGPFPSSMRPGP
ncbi:hypothetical protein FYK55_26865 [Roseiconus nitratireducens]|uniref:Uncharacterized protein n=1 Tax=Roseiconus nitratireducens TaxID=2605748 RepID=A0A5M6CUL2_9BACT|nr:hypothetical protein [Roseiconus nitratireducens]KAA5538636.1 hypothetical protein FYK55_26865 [Roseiconus nitratireducens]